MSREYRVENQWGGSSAPWHDGGEWIIGGRDNQNVVAMNISSNDNGQTLTGSMTYANEGPIAFRATQLSVIPDPEPQPVLKQEKITSRSSLTEDYKPTQDSLNPKPVYRTSISVSPFTSFIDIWASEETSVEIDELVHTIDPIKSARVPISQLAKVSVSIPATDLRCPHLIVRTDLMSLDRQHYIFPDIEAHKKIIELKDGDLFRAKEKIGIPDRYTEEDLNHFQRSLQNIAKTVQHTYNKSSHGIHHDRAMLAKNMQHPHFMLDFANNSPRYKPLTPSEVSDHISNARLVQGAVAQGFWGSIGHFIKKATHIVVHTVEDVGKDIVKTAENVGHDAVHTVEKVGEDVVHGDILHIKGDLIEGGENIGKDISKGGSAVGEDVISGAKHLVVLTIHTAEEAVQFVLKHTGMVGRVLGKLFQKIGAALDKVVDWFLDKIDWSAVLHTHDVLLNFFNRRLDEAQSYPAMLKEKSDRFFTHLIDLVSDDIEEAIHSFEGVEQTEPLPPLKSHSRAAEKIEWLLGKFVHHSSDSNEPNFFNLPESNDLITLIEEHFGKENEITGALADIKTNLENLFTHPDYSFDHLIEVTLKLAKDVAIVSLDAMKVILDVVLDLIVATIEGFKKMINSHWHIPFLGEIYTAITQGRQMSFLSLSCLLLAVPVTISYKAEFGEAPFSTYYSSSALKPLNGSVKAQAFSYAACHLVLSVFSAVSDAAASLTENVSVHIAELLFGGIAQALASPIPMTETYKIPPYSDRKDVLKAPNFWSHLVWLYQFTGIAVNLTLSTTILMAKSRKSKSWEKRGEYAYTIFNGFYGLAHMGLMATIDVADRAKQRELRRLYDLNELKEDHEDQKNYLDWANGGGIPSKSFGNIMDTFPEIANFGFIPLFAKAEYPLIIAIIIDVSGHLFEASTVAIRTADDGLL